MTRPLRRLPSLFRANLILVYALCKLVWFFVYHLTLIMLIIGVFQPLKPNLTQIWEFLGCAQCWVHRLLYLGALKSS